MTNSPLAFASPLYFKPVSMLVAVTFTPARAAPELSVIVPTTAAVESWARSVGAIGTHRTSPAASRPRHLQKHRFPSVAVRVIGLRSAFTLGKIPPFWDPLLGSGGLVVIRFTRVVAAYREQHYINLLTLCKPN